MSLEKNTSFIVNFSIIHNHHRPTKIRLPHALAVFSKEFVQQEISKEEVFQIHPNTKTLKLKLVQNLLEKFPGHSDKIRSIVNRSYISSVLKNNRRIEQKQSLSDQFLYYFNKLQEDSFDIPFVKDAIVFSLPKFYRNRKI